jgi:ABC-type transporter Mla subunit MlaD
MKWERTDLTVGTVVLLAILIVSGAFVSISPALSEDTYPLYTEYRRIDGIAEQAGVFLHGYSVGRVSAIEPRVNDAGVLVFRVEMKVRRRLASGDTLYLPEGTIARLTPPPVPIGGGMIVLEAPASGGRPLAPGETLPGLRSVAMMDQMQGLTGDMGGEVMQTLVAARLLMDSLASTISAANQTMAVTSSHLPGLLAGIQQELTAAHELTNDLRTQLGVITPAAVASIDSAQHLLGDSRRLVQQIDELLREQRPELAGILANLDTTTMLLQNFMWQVSERPWRVFTGVKAPAGLTAGSRDGEPVP